MRPPVGLGVIVVWLALTLAVTHVAEPVGAAEMVAGYEFFLFSAALGTSFRYHAKARVRDIEQAKLRQRNQLARELHDTVGHHVSAIAVAAHAGRIAAASHPDRALTALETIEDAASRTLEKPSAVTAQILAASIPKGSTRTPWRLPDHLPDRHSRHHHRDRAPR